MKLCFALASLFFVLSPKLFAAPAKIIHQSDGVIVRMGADEWNIVWQEVSNDTSKRYLLTYDMRTGRKNYIDAKRRPFGPAVSQGLVVYGAGNIIDGVNVQMHDLVTKRTFVLQNLMPWISEPAIQVTKGADGKDMVQVVWDISDDLLGNGLRILMYEGGRDGKGKQKVLAEGPMLLRDQIPPESYKAVSNEYPEISGESLVFQNNEFGVPNIYRMDLTSKSVERISPSNLFQERPAIDGRYSAWEESERGFGASDLSDIYLHDAVTGEVKKINPDMGFHYQVRIKDHYLIYGAKRIPLSKTPSIRIYDVNANVEYDASKCFAGSIYDWSASKTGVLTAQRMQNNTSRLLFSTWEQIKEGCR